MLLLVNPSEQPRDLPADLTAPLREAIAEAEQLIAGAENVRSGQDLLEGYDYLAGRIRTAVQLAFDHDLERPVLINSTHQYARQGLDNPDAIYLHAYLTDGVEYVLRGRRGTTADLSFQVLGGGYDASGAPPSLAAFDDRELDIAPDGTFELRLGPFDDGAKTLVVREVYNDWDTEERGTLWIENPAAMGVPAKPLDGDRMRQRYEVAAKLLTGTIRTWFAFPKFFQDPLPVNTLTAPQSTPGGLESQRSSIGHYSLAEDEALVVSVPRCDDYSYQAIQVGSDWYASTDYETHQTSLTKAQSVTDPDGVMRYVVSDRDPGIANWLETTGHATGPMMLRWQRLERELGPEDGPTVEVVPFDDVRKHLPHYEPISREQYAERIAARQRSVARRMIS